MQATDKALPFLSCRRLHTIADWLYVQITPISPLLVTLSLDILTVPQNASYAVPTTTLSHLEDEVINYFLVHCVERYLFCGCLRY